MRRSDSDHWTSQVFQPAGFGPWLPTRVAMPPSLGRARPGHISPGSPVTGYYLRRISPHGAICAPDDKPMLIAGLTRGLLSAGTRLSVRHLSSASAGRLAAPNRPWRSTARRGGGLRSAPAPSFWATCSRAWRMMRWQAARGLSLPHFQIHAAPAGLVNYGKSA